MNNGSSLSEGQLFTIEALNRIDGFVWPDGMICAGMFDGGRSVLFAQGAIYTMSDFAFFNGRVTGRLVGVTHPDWRDSLITREQFDSVDGWVRHDNAECPANSESLVQVQLDGLKVGNPGHAHIAKEWAWVDGGITHWRYHKPAKQNNKSIEQLIAAWQKAKANADTSRAILQLAEKEALEAREAVENALCSAGWGAV